MSKKSTMDECDSNAESRSNIHRNNAGIEMIKYLLLILVIALASAMTTNAIDVSISSSDGVDINFVGDGLEMDDNVFINGEQFNGIKDWTDENRTLYHLRWYNGKLDEYNITFLNGTKAITLFD